MALLPLSGVDAWRILSRRRPDLVIGVGGYSSGPVVLAAALRGIPTMLLEQNAVPGLTNRLLARGRQRRGGDVRIDACRFSEGGPLSQATRFVRSSSTLTRVQSGDGAGGAAPRVLIFGGSQGAHAINVAMVEAAPRLADAAGLAVTHQTGERDLERVRDGTGGQGCDARVEPFLYDMDREMSSRRPRRLPRRARRRSPS